MMLQKFGQDQNPILASGQRRYQEWMDNLLCTPGARARFAKLEEEFDLLLQLVDARMEAGLAQAELAKRLGVSRAKIARIEQCGYQACSLDILQRYAATVGKKLQISLV